MTNIQQLMKMGQQLQAKVKELHDSLESEEIEATSGGGMVTARVSGRGDLISVTIDPLAVDPRGRRDARRPGAGGGRRGTDPGAGTSRRSGCAARPGAFPCSFQGSSSSLRP